MGAGRPAPPPAGTIAVLRDAVLVPLPGAEVSWQVGEEDSSGRGQVGRDNPVWRRAPLDRAASRRTGAAAKVCKGVRVGRAAGRRV